MYIFVCQYFPWCISQVLVQPYQGVWDKTRVIHLPLYQSAEGETLQAGVGRPPAKTTVRYEALKLQVELMSSGELMRGATTRLNQRGWGLLYTNPLNNTVAMSEDVSRIVEMGAFREDLSTCTDRVCSLFRQSRSEGRQSAKSVSAGSTSPPFGGGARQRGRLAG